MISEVNIGGSACDSQQICPECGHSMFVADKIRENEFVFIWYECSHTGCSGQWLQKNRCEPKFNIASDSVIKSAGMPQ